MAVRYTCENCGKEFEYYRFKSKLCVNHFCSRDCRIEWHYFNQDMSNTQLNVLEYLITSGGSCKLTDCAAIDSLHYRVVPLIEVLHRHKSKEVLVQITDRGLYWYQQKRSDI